MLMKVCINTCCPSCPRTFPSPFHSLSFALSKYTLSPDTYFVSLLVPILLFSTRRIFSEFSHETNASLALCKAARLSVRILQILEGVSTGGLSINADGSFEFCLRASWKGETQGHLQVSFWHSDARIGQDQDSIVILQVFYPSYL